MGTFYDDPRYGVPQTLSLDGISSQTSVIAANTVVSRHTFIHAVTVQDWNLRIINGDVLTGTADAASWRLAIGKSLAGTGTLAYIGTAKLSALALGGTYADGSVLDCTCTGDTDFAAGDDIVLAFVAGTALPAGAIRVGADVRYVEKFVTSD